MILSYERGFCFIKTAKTAGTSVEIALSSVCGPTDIVTPISPADEAQRAAYGGRGPQNCWAPFRRYNSGDLVSLFRYRYRKRAYFNHMSAHALIDEMGASRWGSLYSFCVERNPWDRLVSWYYWLNRNGSLPTFASFVASDAPLRLRKSGSGLYSRNGRPVVTKICRFESLHEDFDDVQKVIGIDPPLALPKSKGGFRASRKPYQEYYGEAERERVADVFAFEIDLMGYSFD